MTLRHQPHIGAAGWHRQDWLSILGPASSTRHRHPLESLATYLDLAEVDQSFFEPLKPEIAALWVRKVSSNPRFLFTALLGRRFTYDRDLDDASVSEWKLGFFPLLRANRLGALILQFPWAFRFTEENRRFLIDLRRAFHEFPLVAEFRHDSWLMDEAVTTLINYHVGLASIDQPSWFRAMPPAAALTSGVAVVRLHGRRNPDAFREFAARPDPGYLYSLDELLEWKPRLERFAAYAERTLVIATNARQARSFVNALQVREILGDSRLVAPAGLIRQYPAELAAFRASRPVQHLLLPVSAQAA